LVFYKGKVYIKGADGKLIPFKAKIGKPFIKGGKVFVIDSNGLPLLLDVGEVVDYNSDKYLVSKNNHLLSLSKKMEDELSIQAKHGSIWIEQLEFFNESRITRRKYSIDIVRKR